MTDIVIDLDQPPLVPETDKTLLEIIKMGAGWTAGATCATQECDGEILWWSAPLRVVREAREKANLSNGLIPRIGWGQLMGSDYYAEDDQELVASDWSTAVVTLEQFVNLES